MKIEKKSQQKPGQSRASMMLKQRVSMQKKLNFDKSLNKRKKHNLILYFWSIFAMAMFAGQIVVYLHSGLEQRDLLLVGLAIWVFQISCWIACLVTLTGWRQFLSLFLLVDNILIAQAASAIVLGTLFTLKGPLTYSRWTFAFVTPLNLHLQSTAFRVFMIQADWCKWKVLLFKFSLFILSLFYIAYSCYFIVAEYTFTQGRRPALDEKIKEYFILYTCANFAYNFELYGKMTDFDGTNFMKSNYKLINLEWLKQKAIKEQQQEQNNVNNCERTLQVQNQHSLSIFKRINQVKPYTNSRFAKQKKQIVMVLNVDNNMKAQSDPSQSQYQ